MLNIAKDPISNEEFVVYDGIKHGYDSMFCIDSKSDARRDLKIYKKYNGKIQIKLGYSIDYEDEKSD